MRLIISLVMVTLLLAACGGEAEPTSSVFSDPTVDASQFTATPPDYIENQLNEMNATEEVDGDGNVIIVTPQSQIQENAVPLPGTLAYDTEYTDENMGAVFDRIVFVRSGGGEDSPTYLLKLKQDGSYELNKEQVGQVDATTVSRIDGILDEINFFGINTPMLGPGAESENYRYTITVERAGDEMTLRAEDGFTPQPVMQLFGALLGIITNAENTAITTATPAAGA